MTYDAMGQLTGIKALPRGERIARFYENVDGKTRFFVPLWSFLVEQGLIGQVSFYITHQKNSSPDEWRKYAAPLRNIREERLRLREIRDRLRDDIFAAKTALKKYGTHACDCPVHSPWETCGCDHCKALCKCGLVSALRT